MTSSELITKRDIYKVIHILNESHIVKISIHVPAYRHIVNHRVLDLSQPTHFHKCIRNKLEQTLM